MARVTLTLTRTGAGTGLAPTMVAATALGHVADNASGTMCLVVKNGNATEDVTVLVACQDDRQGLARESRQVDVPAGTDTMLIGFLSAELHQVRAGTDKGSVHIDFAPGDLLTDVSIAAVRPS